MLMAPGASSILENALSACEGGGGVSDRMRLFNFQRATVFASGLLRVYPGYIINEDKTTTKSWNISSHCCGYSCPLQWHS